MSDLARIIDPSELERAEGTHGRMTVDVAAEWLAAGARVELQVPRRLVCAVCDGGGCDRCARSGAIRLDLDALERVVCVGLPATTSERVVVRMVRPFGDAAGLEQLSVEVRAAGEPSIEVRRLRAPAESARGVQPMSLLLAMLVAVAAALAAAFALHR